MILILAELKETSEPPLSYPYLGKDVLDGYITAKWKKKSRNDELYPTEWVGLRTRKAGQTKITFVQVAYAILPENFASEESTSTQVKQYKVFVKENDYEGTKIVDRSELVRLGSEDQPGATSGWKAASSNTVSGGGSEPVRRESEDQPEQARLKLEHQSRPDQELGNKWMKQVNVDTKILQDLLKKCLPQNSQSKSSMPTSPPKMYATLCFLAQQVAEKAMTAAIIYFIGSEVDNFSLFRGHNLLERVNILQYKKNPLWKV